MIAQEEIMFPQMKLRRVPLIYQICLLGEDGATTLVYETECTGEDEAIEKLFAIRDVPYASFEIFCGNAMVSQGSRHR
jgi:hypothetical protein